MPMIFAVDDRADSLMLMEKIAQRHGFEFHGVNHVDDLLTLLEKSLPDVIIIDIILPGQGDGIDLGRYIRNRYGVKIPMVAVTAGSAMELRALALSSGFDAYLQKPFTVRSFHEAVTDAVANNKARA